MIRLHGTQDRASSRPRLTPSAPVTVPADLEAAVAGVWGELAPLAEQAGTLVAGTVPAFRRLCQAIVRHASMEAQISRDGLTYLKVTIDGAGQEQTEVKAHPLISRAHSLDNAIRGWMKDFAINPFGKPLAVEDKPVDPFAEFEQGA